ncbi:hypothetical protein BKA65DRAFT_47940 [Rhexocercosporidium sp. MPI-PUGE-AT-0058]|nr:hypothetical protein BKA65DRAFT_47940 [Rhexocercosporidium sp. MPI-PUGE-AT-0058]
MSRKNKGGDGTITHTKRNTVPATGSRETAVANIKSEDRGEVEHRRQAAIKQLSWASARFLLAVAIIVQAICALFISQYDPSHSGLVMHKLPKSVCIPSLAPSCSWKLEIPSAILDPSSFVFINCLTVYGLSVILLCDAQKDDQYQHHILGLGFFGGIVVTGTMAVNKGALSPLKDYMPAVITLTILASLFMHSILRR